MRSILALLAISFALDFFASGADFSAGTGRVDITPRRPVHLGGYASRLVPFKTVAQTINVKALALKDAQGQLTLILTADTIGTPGWFNAELAGRVESELHIPRERFLFACSHSHSTPVIKGALENAYNLDTEAAKAVETYTREFLESSLKAAQMAVANLEPVTVSFGRGEAHFAVNRRQFNKNGVSIGVNPDGQTDKGVPVLRIGRRDGSVKAVVFGYACHCTTLGATDEVSGDWAGYAQSKLEEAYPGSLALFITGCGADANPGPRGKPFHVAQHGLALAGAVAETMNLPMVEVRGPIHTAFGNAILPLDKLPSRETFADMSTNAIAAVARHGLHFQAMLDRGEALPSSYPCPVQVLRFGKDLVLIAMGGEVVSDYSFRLQRELKEERVWAAGYCNDVFAYVPSVRILIEGGYEADTSMVYYGLPTRFAPEVEERLVSKVLTLVNRTKQP